MSGYTAYPYASYVPMNYLYEFERGFALAAVLDASAARSVRLTGRSAHVDVRGVRFGTDPRVFDLPPR